MSFEDRVEAERGRYILSGWYCDGGPFPMWRWWQRINSEELDFPPLTLEALKNTIKWNHSDDKERERLRQYFDDAGNLRYIPNSVFDKDGYLIFED